MPGQFLPHYAALAKKRKILRPRVGKPEFHSLESGRKGLDPNRSGCRRHGKCGFGPALLPSGKRQGGSSVCDVPQQAQVTSSQDGHRGCHPARRYEASSFVLLTVVCPRRCHYHRRSFPRLNRAITGEILAKAKCAPTTILIVLATPVDDIAPFAQRATGLPPSQVIRFGGDLDRNRLASILLSRGLPADHISVVGEHGRKVIPVYAEEEDYDQVASRAHNYLSTVIELAGLPRNLATSVLLDELVQSIAADSQRTHHVCGYHPEFGMFLTWPFKVGRQELSGPETVHLGRQAQGDLDKLIEERRRKAELLASIG